MEIQLLVRFETPRDAIWDIWKKDLGLGGAALKSRFFTGF